MRCSGLQCVAVSLSLFLPKTCESVVVVVKGVSQCVAACCTVLQCVAVCYSVLQSLFLFRPKMGERVVVVVKGGVMAM